MKIHMKVSQDEMIIELGGCHPQGKFDDRHGCSEHTRLDSPCEQLIQHGSCLIVCRMSFSALELGSG
jgi:hypothetical protein